MPRTPGPSARIVLVTGVSRYLGARFAMALQAEPGIERIIGVDVTPPRAELGRVEFVHADIRGADVGNVISSAEVDTVVHLNLVTAQAGGRSTMKEINVIGTMQLLAACQRSARLRRLVVRSSAAVYGSSPGAPAVFGEDDTPARPPRSGYPKDAAEIEEYVHGLARRRGDLTVSMLRFGSLVGPTVDSPLTRYFQLPVVPTMLGFDPRLQFIHEDDVVEILRRMTIEDHPGTFNAAGTGVLALSQAVRQAGRAAVPMPRFALRASGDLGRRLGLGSDFPSDLLDLLRYGRVLDTARLEAELSWQPRYGSRAAFADFVRARGLGRSMPLELFDQFAGEIDRMTSPKGAGEVGGQ